MLKIRFVLYVLLAGISLCLLSLLYHKPDTAGNAYEDKGWPSSAYISVVEPDGGGGLCLGIEGTGLDTTPGCANIPSGVQWSGLIKDLIVWEIAAIVIVAGLYRVKSRKTPFYR